MRKTALPVPLEDDEQIDFVKYLETRGLKFTAIPNSTYTKYISVKMRNHRLGLRPGLCDVLVVLPATGLAFVEMKRIRGSTTSDEQKEWIAVLNTIPNVEARVCKGALAAIAFIEELYPSSKSKGPTLADIQKVVDDIEPYTTEDPPLYF